MGFVEGILCEIHHRIINAVGSLLVDPIGHTALDSPLCISVNKALALRINHILFFLTHGTADVIGLSHGIPGKLLHDLHNLLLVNNTSVSRFQNGFQLRCHVHDFVWIVLTLDIIRDKIHRSRTIQGNTGHNVLEILRLQLLHKVLHSRRLQLEHALGLTGSDEIQHGLIVEINVVNIHIDTGGCLNILYGILQHGKCPKSQKIHLQKSQFLQLHHVILRCRTSVTGSSQRHIITCHSRINDHPRRMNRSMVWQPLQALCHIDQIMHPRIPFIEASEFRIHLQCTINGNVEFHGHHLGHTVHLGIREIKRFSHRLNDTPRRHGTEGYDLRYRILAILFRDILNGAVALRILKIHINIRHGHTLRIQETLKEQIVFDGIDVRDSGAIAHLASRSRASSRSNPAVMSPAPVDVVPDNQNILHKAHLLDNAQLILHILIDALTLFLRVFRIVFVFVLKSLVT